MAQLAPEPPTALALIPGFVSLSSSPVHALEALVPAAQPLDKSLPSFRPSDRDQPLDDALGTRRRGESQVAGASRTQDQQATREAAQAHVERTGWLRKRHVRHGLSEEDRGDRDGDRELGDAVGEVNGRKGNGGDAREGRAALRRRSVCERRGEVSSSLLASSLAALPVPEKPDMRSREGAKTTYLDKGATVCDSRRTGVLAEVSEVGSAATGGRARGSEAGRFRVSVGGETSCARAR